jgi:hypothetical protein
MRWPYIAPKGREGGLAKWASGTCYFNNSKEAFGFLSLSRGFSPSTPPPPGPYTVSRFLLSAVKYYTWYTWTRQSGIFFYFFFTNVEYWRNARISDVTACTRFSAAYRSFRLSPIVGNFVVVYPSFIILGVSSDWWVSTSSFCAPNFHNFSRQFTNSYQQLMIFICGLFKDAVSSLDQWYSTFSVPPDVISLQLCTPPKVVGV